jgi:hypothetical protein
LRDRRFLLLSDERWLYLVFAYRVLTGFEIERDMQCQQVGSQSEPLTRSNAPPIATGTFYGMTHWQALASPRFRQGARPMSRSIARMAVRVASPLATTDD